MAQLEESKALDLSGLEHYNQKLNDEKIGNITNLGGGKTDLGTEASIGIMNIASLISLTNSTNDDVYCRISCGDGKMTFDVVTGTDIYTAYLSPNPGGDIAMESYVDNKTWDASDITSGTLSWERLPTVPLSKGGTGVSMSSAPLLLVNLASTSADNPLSSSSRPGVTGTLPISRGGTGRTTAPSMLVNLSSTSAASPLSATPRPGVTGVLPASHGGTGVSNLKDLIKFDYTASTKTLNITVDESLLGA